MRAFAVVFCLLSVTACDESLTGPSVALNEEFQLQPGSSAVVAGAFAVRFNGVSGDSRCPADVFCIQGGDAIVGVTVIDDGRARNFELHTGDMRPFQFDGYTVELIELRPYPFSSQTIAPNDYRATLKVTR